MSMGASACPITAAVARQCSGSLTERRLHPPGSAQLSCLATPHLRPAWRTSRLDSVRVVLSNGQMEDPLENEEQLQEQMDSLPYMCRFQYDKSVELLMGRMDPIIAAYSKADFPTPAHHRACAELAGRNTTSCEPWFSSAPVPASCGLGRRA